MSLSKATAEDSYFQIGQKVEYEFFSVNANNFQFYTDDYVASDGVVASINIMKDMKF